MKFSLGKFLQGYQSSIIRVLSQWPIVTLALAGPAFSVVRQAREGGLRGPDAKNQGYHPLIEIKLGMSHYGHKSIPGGKLESGSFSSFGDMTSQNFPQRKGTSHKIWLFTPGKWV